MRPVFDVHAGLSAVQRASRAATRAEMVGGALGIIVGCIIGSFPLLFYEEKTTEQVLRAADTDHDETISKEEFRAAIARGKEE